MGTNYFIEGEDVEPIEINLKLNEDKGDDFQHFERIFKSFRYISDISESVLKNFGFAKEDRYRKRAKVIYFKLASPFDITILADPQWLIIFVTLLIGYKPIKENIIEITSDATNFIGKIIGLAGYELELLNVAVKLTAERLNKLIRRNKSTNRKVRIVGNQLKSKRQLDKVKIRVNTRGNLRFTWGRRRKRRLVKG